MSKTLIAVLVVVVAALGIWYWMGLGQQVNTEVNTGVEQAKAGEHCGGNMTTAKSCVPGYHCAPEPGSHLPFGDVGGICVPN